MSCVKFYQYFLNLVNTFCKFINTSYVWFLVPQIDPLVRLYICTITEKALTRAFSWLKAATTAFTFNTLLRHYAKWALAPRSINVKLGPQRKSHKGQAGWLA